MSDMITRGDTELYDLPLFDQFGNPFDLTDCTVWVTCKENSEDPDEDALFQHYIVIDEHGSVVDSKGLYLVDDDPTLGQLVERISPEESTAFDLGNYVLDVQVRFPSTVVPGEYDIETPINGEPVEVVFDITRALEVDTA